MQPRPDRPKSQHTGAIALRRSTERFQTHNGVELTVRRRMSHHSLLNSSFAYNSAVVHNGYAGAGANTMSEDPSNLAARHGFQYDPLTAGSGLANVYVNAKWLFKLSGVYEAPYGINVSAFYNARQGYPFEASGVDIYNLLNSNAVQALQRAQNASTANNISAVVAPRVIRAGVKLTW